jgi:hypothetical protein
MSMSMRSRPAFSGELQELAARKRRFAAGLALRIGRLAQELDEGDARDLDRILEAEEQARRRALVRFEREQVFARKVTLPPVTS